MNRRPRLLLTSLFLLVVLVGVPVWLTWRAVRQERLDRSLIAAVKQRKADIVISLLHEGADPNARDLPQESRPSWRRLLDRWRRRPIAAENNAYPSALQLAIGEYWENYRMVRALVEKGAQVNVRDPGGRTPLMYSAAANEPDGLSGIRILDLLLKYGAAVNARDRNGNSALVLAAQSGNQQKVRLLLERQADVGVKDSDGRNALMDNIEREYAASYRRYCR